VQGVSNRRETVQLLVAPLIFHCASSVPERCTPKTGRTHCENQFWPTPRRWASRPAVSGSPCYHGTGHHSATLQRRGVGKSCHRAGATMPGHESRRPDKIAWASRLRCHAGCFRDM